MSARTPFFATFQRLLFGKPPLSEAEKLLWQEGSSPALSQYREAFGEFIPKGALGLGKSGKNSRARIFPAPRCFERVAKEKEVTGKWG